jgi:enoyl-CoA hydratase/carnithine racemase
MTDPRVELAIDGALATITLRRPEKLNALDQGMIAALAAACDRVESERAVRVVLLAGEGKAFSAGGDIEAWAALDPLTFGRLWIRDGHRTMDRLARLRQPTIAVLTGHALGGGLELAAVADFRVAEAHVRLGLPETGLGMVPGWSGTQRLVRRFGAQLVRRMSIAGEMLGADQALAAGLVDRVVPTGEGPAAAREMADRLLTRGPAALQVAKQMIALAEGEERDGAIESIAGALIATTADLAEGVGAFRAKRAATFEDR